MQALNATPSSPPNKMKAYTIRDFNQDFPDDAACLEWLKNFLYPAGIECNNKTCRRFGQVTKHYRVESRPSYSCAYCGHHVHPTAGTIFHKSTTPLKLWFYAVHLMASTRCGISAKQIQRETGTTYKTAWRMFRKIRTLLQESVPPLSGEVEVDETYIGGRKRTHGTKKEAAMVRYKNKQVVAGHVQRGGKVRAIHLPDGTAKTLLPQVRQFILPASIIYTDELPIYKRLPSLGYEHRRINHAARVYVDGDTHTNSVEGFFSLVKRGISGVYHSVSAKHLQSYLNEYTFRYNHRKDTNPMFWTMLGQVALYRSDGTPGEERLQSQSS